MPVADVSFLGEPQSLMWGIVAFGLVITSLVVLVGWFFSGREPDKPSRLIPARSEPLPHLSVPVPDPFVHESALEHRATPRRRGNPVIVLMTNADATAEPVRATVVDRSVGGLRLEVEKAVAVGTVLSVRPTGLHQNTPWVQIEVMNCVPAKGHWEIGCRFLRTPTWGVLLLFG